MKPKILLSLDRPNYPEAIKAAGGEPVIGGLPDDAESFDGLLICGGPDVSPSRYGEQINGSVGIDEERDDYEFTLADAFVKAKKPILGICRGYQLLNIYFGGSLFRTVPLSFMEMAFVTALAFLIIPADFLRKVFLRVRSGKRKKKINT